MSMQTPFARCCWRKARAMHVIFRETHGMEETAVPQDLGQEPADLVVLSFRTATWAHSRRHGIRPARAMWRSLRCGSPIWRR